MKAGLNDRLDKPEVITAHCLNTAISSRLYQAGILFFVEEQIRAVDLFTLEFDGLDKLLGNKFRCLAAYTVSNALVESA